MSNPKVSLLVPCYNIANVCEKFFESLLNQTYDNLEIVLVNDGSKDNTEEVLLENKEKLEQIRQTYAAAREAQIREEEYWVDYVVKAGDSLSSIAAKASGTNAETIELTKRIMSKNDLDSSFIYIGQHLKIVNPYNLKLLH